MAIIANRTKINNKWNEFSKLILVVFKRFLIVIFITLSMYLLYFSGPTSKKVSSLTLEITGPFIAGGVTIYEALASGVNFFTQKLSYFQDLEAENIKLKFELASIKQARSDVQSLEAENLALKKLLMVVEDRKYNYTTARLLNVSRTPFSKTALIGAGLRAGIEVDQIVTTSSGLLGRVIEVSNNYAKVMLVSDYNSRIPVITSISRIRGILAGNNGKSTIVYLQENHPIEKGEEIITSGDGKVYPPGVAVARVTDVYKGNVTAAPLVNLANTDFVVVYSNDAPD